VAVELNRFVAEGKLEVGPKEEYFVFLDGDHLGKLLVNHFRAPGELGYCNLGRVRITVEQLQEV
jgi:hypothetical protein